MGGACVFIVPENGSHDLLVYDKSLQHFQRRIWRIKLQMLPPRPPISMLEEFALCVLGSILRTKVCNTDINIAPTLKSGVQGANPTINKYVVSRNCCLQVRPSVVLQTFVRHLSDGACFLLLRFAL